VREDVTIPVNAHTQSAGSSALASEGYEKWPRKFLPTERSPWRQICSLRADVASDYSIVSLPGGQRIAGQKSVSECVGKATRTAFRTAARSIISCATAPPIGGRYPNAAAIIPKILNTIPPMAD
jgi:hypothetical protein